MYLMEEMEKVIDVENMISIKYFFFKKILWRKVNFIN